VHEFSVWAPFAQQVDLVIDGSSQAMRRGAGGWWRLSAHNSGPGTRYGFSVDGGPVRPDPRSRSQPDGVHAPSALVDPAGFPWTDQTWKGASARGLVLYELHIGTFTPEGTFDSAIERLGHLAALGVSAVELMPVAEFPGTRGWGYDGVDLFAPHHGYGGPDGLKRFVDACHSKGIGAVVDVVYNHLGPSGNYLREFGPYFSDRHQTNWGAAVNFDGPGSDEVRRFVIDNAKYWLEEFHFDGLRLDAVHAIVDESAYHLLEELAAEVDALATHLRRPLFVIAESDRNDPRLARSRDAGGYGLDCVWADDWHHALHAALTGDRAGYYSDFGSLELLAKALRQAWVYDGIWSERRGRRHGRSPAGLAGQRFVVFTQNHDQIGNRAVGDRLAALVGEGRQKIAASLLLTAPFTPMIFQGEEWAASSPFQYFTDHDDPKLAKAVGEGRRSEFTSFGWDPSQVPDPQSPDTYRRSKLDWEELDKEPHDDILKWYRTLIEFRRRHSELSDPLPGSAVVEASDELGTITVRRGSIRVAVNLSAGDRAFDLPPDSETLAFSTPSLRTEQGQMILPRDSVAIVKDPPNTPRP
jgi:maltooligosyltrehalose trehalohydrolase